MYLCFADDSRQKRPTRPGIQGALVGLGAILVPAGHAGDLERDLEKLCVGTGFPAGEEFKWSPGRDLWMHRNLVEDARVTFFLEVTRLLGSAGCSTLVVAEDEGRGTAITGMTHEQDITAMLVERLDNRLAALASDGMLIIDRPAGGRRQEDDFLTDCVELLEKGTEYVKPKHMPIKVVTANSHHIRLLQAADLVAGSSVGCVAGEKSWSPSIFSEVVALMAKDRDRVGGISFKLHPDLSFANLYHWLAGDGVIWRGGTGHGLPMKSRPYADDQWVS
jgi:hypothetical protein